MSGQFKASLSEMQVWAKGIQVSRPPDVVIGDNYLLRWWILPRNDFQNLYLHKFNRSDIDRALHDHPWPSTSFILQGRYLEHTPAGVFERRAGDVVSRPAEAMHRVELYPGESATTIFATGPKQREWGFGCEHGWVHWRDFTHPEDSSRVGRGCGEQDDLTRTSQPGTMPKEVADASA